MSAAKKKTGARASKEARVTGFDHERLVRVESAIAEWARSVDEAAAPLAVIKAPRPSKGRPTGPDIVTGITPPHLRRIQGVDRAVDLIEKAKRALAQGDLIPATWHLDRAEAIYHMQYVTPFTVTGIVQKAEASQNEKRVAAHASTAARSRRKKIVLDARAALATVLSRQPTQPELFSRMVEQSSIRKGEKGRYYIYSAEGERVGKPLPRRRYPLKDILR